MVIAYGHPAHKGPARFKKYNKEEILKHFAEIGRNEDKTAKIMQGPAVAIKVSGLLMGIAMAALMCREHDESLGNVWFDKDRAEVWLRLSNIDHMDDYIALVDRYSEADLWKVKEDRFGNGLFEGGGTVV